MWLLPITENMSVDSRHPFRLVGWGWLVRSGQSRSNSLHLKQYTDKRSVYKTFHFLTQENTLFWSILLIHECISNSFLCILVTQGIYKHIHTHYLFLWRKKPQNSSSSSNDRKASVQNVYDVRKAVSIRSWYRSLWLFAYLKMTQPFRSVSWPSLWIKVKMKFSRSAIKTVRDKGKTCQNSSDSIFLKIRPLHRNCQLQWNVWCLNTVFHCHNLRTFCLDPFFRFCHVNISFTLLLSAICGLFFTY